MRLVIQSSFLALFNKKIQKTAISEIKLRQAMEDLLHANESEYKEFDYQEFN